MDRTVLAMLAVMALSGCMSQDSEMTSTASAFSADDESAVLALVHEFANTWNRHDMKGMHDLDTEDVEWINVTGNYWRGKTAVYKGHDTIHRSIFAHTSMSVEQTAIRSIASNVAVAVATMTFGPVITPTGQRVAEIKTRGSFTIVKRDGIWKIAHFQNTTVDLEAEKNDPITWDESGSVPGRKEGDHLDGGRKKALPTDLTKSRSLK